jgi:predicted enzyme related to lactoylglutathione lyase
MVLKRDISRQENRMTTETTKQRRPNNMVWFELPVSDLGRATAFYETIFATKLTTDERFPTIAMFPRYSEMAATGALAEFASQKPSTDGTVVYLNCDGQMDAVLKRAQAAGAKVLEEVAQLPGGMGWIAQFRDLDGNRVGLHATF